MSIPEFILRKLIVPGSLKRLENGFSFVLLNNLAPASITCLFISVDGEQVVTSQICLKMDAANQLQASAINSGSPFHFPLGTPLTISISGSAGPKTDLSIGVDTLEYGSMNFRIQVEAKNRSESLLGWISKRFTRKLAHAQTQPNVIDDRLRPGYHFLPPQKWMNDPNGVIHWKGEYHLFYQHNPIQATWGKIHWGHAVSNDLIHWRHLDLAMSPTPGGPDGDGVWSGCAVNVGGKPVVFYTGVFPEVQCMAATTDDLVTLEKYAGNPIIPHPSAEIKLTGFRDPCVWQEGNAWFMIIGSGFENLGGALLLYTSRDLIHWEYLHPMLTADKVGSEKIDLGNMWECPQMFPFGDQHLLFFSPCDQKGSYYVVYLTGRYLNGQFYPQQIKKLDFGDEFFYAPQAFLDEQGRRIMFGWCREERSQEAQIQAGWAGVMSLPRLIEPRPDGLPGFRPADEVESLRQQHFHLEDIHLMPNSTNPLVQIQSDSLELQVELEAGIFEEFRINLCMSPDKKEYTRLSYFPGSSRFTVDTTHASLDPQSPGSVHEIPYVPFEGETFRLRMFVDRSILEVFLNGWACLTARMYPTLQSSKGLEINSKGGVIRIKSIDCWKISPAKG